MWDPSTKTSCLSPGSDDVCCHLKSTLLTEARGLDAFSSVEAMPVTSIKLKAWILLEPISPRSTFPYAIMKAIDCDCKGYRCTGAKYDIPNPVAGSRQHHLAGLFHDRHAPPGHCDEGRDGQNHAKTQSKTTTFTHHHFIPFSRASSAVAVPYPFRCSDLLTTSLGKAATASN